MVECNYHKITQTSSIDINDDNDLDLLDPFSKYNYFIDTYNQEFNIVNNITLRRIKIFKMNIMISKIKAKKLFYITFLFIFMVLPVLNILFFIILLYDFYIYLENSQIHDDNLQKIPNPFSRMVFSPSLCKNLRKNNWIFSIEVKSFPGFFLNLEILEIIKTNEKEGVVTFMIYNEKFKEYFEGFPLLYKKYIKEIMIALTLIILSGGLLFMYIYLLILRSE